MKLPDEITRTPRSKASFTLEASSAPAKPATITFRTTFPPIRDNFLENSFETAKFSVQSSRDPCNTVGRLTRVATFLIFSVIRVETYGVAENSYGDYRKHVRGSNDKWYLSI